MTIKSKIICIDPGHGGTDPGAVNGAFTEKYAVLSIGTALKKELVKRGYTVYMTRETDVYHTPYQKAKYGNQVGADIFVSIHCNAAASESAHGTETLSYDLDGKSYKLAKAIQESLIAVTNLTDRGVKQRKDLIVLNSTTMPAALVETAFISNKEEKLLLMDEAFRQKIAAAIADGINRYYGNVNGENEKDKEVEELAEKVYKNLDEIPEWAIPTIKKLMNKKYLVGDENGNLNLSETAIKLLVINDRANLYGM